MKTDWAQRVLDHLPSALTVIDSDLQLEWSNSAFDAMFAGGQAAGEEKILPAYLEVEVGGLLGRADSDPHTTTILSGPEGRWYMVFVKSLSGTGRYLLDIRDYTEQKKGEERAAQRDRLASIGQLSIGVAHEINNPNAYIRLNALNLKSLMEALSPIYREALEQDPDRKVGNHSLEDLVEKIPRSVESIEKGSDRILKVVGTLKSFGRRETTPLAEVDTGEVVDQALEMCQYLSREVAEIRSRVERPLPRLMGSALDLELVFINLIKNAWDSVGHFRERAEEGYEGAIEIAATTSPDAKRVLVTVTDNGEGIPEDLGNQIFSPFVTSKPHGEGTGLGLAIAHRIVLRHGGSIHFESRPGEGAEFTVALPADPSEDVGAS